VIDFVDSMGYCPFARFVVTQSMRATYAPESSQRKKCRIRGRSSVGVVKLLYSYIWEIRRSRMSP
jgi:ribosomal protein S12